MKDWYLFLNKEQVSRLVTLREENKPSHITWILFSLMLPLAPFIISILISFLLNGYNNWGEILNNGSLPIISYGFVTSGIVYVMERIKKDHSIIFELRERIMPIAVLLLFLNSSIFILETSSIGDFTSLQHLIIFSSSFIVFYYSLRISQIMFFLQKKIVDVDFATKFREETNAIHGKNW